MYQGRNAENDALKAELERQQDELFRFQVKMQRNEEVFAAELARERQQYDDQLLLYR